MVREPGDDADALGLVEEALPGGRFARVRLREADPTRLQLEHYRRRDEIDVLQPII